MKGKVKAGERIPCLSVVWSVYGGVHICQHAPILVCVCVCECEWGYVLVWATISPSAMATRHKNLNYSESMSETYSWVSTDTPTHTHTLSLLHKAYVSPGRRIKCICKQAVCFCIRKPSGLEWPVSDFWVFVSGADLRRGKVTIMLAWNIKTVLALGNT